MISLYLQGKIRIFPVLSTRNLSPSKVAQKVAHKFRSYVNELAIAIRFNLNYFLCDGVL